VDPDGAAAAAPAAQPRAVTGVATPSAAPAGGRADGWVGDERGVALPAALIALLILSSLMLGFLFLAQTEPVIASNHARAAQARSFAESGLEQAIWALNPVGGAPGGGGLAAPAANQVATTPYDGATFVGLNAAGGFTVKITGAGANQVSVESVGWTPSPTAAGTRARRKITAMLMRLTDLARSAPCALCVRGILDLSGPARIDARPSAASACGPKAGTYTAGTVSRAGDAAVYGADGNDTPDQPTDAVENQAAADFDAFAFTDGDLDALRALAKARGAYYRGRVTFDAAHRLRNGIVFVDTASGVNIPADPARQDPADFAAVDVQGSPFVDPAGFRGVLVVNGSLAISGDMTVRGLLYAVNDLRYDRRGGGGISGLVISRNIRDARVAIGAAAGDATAIVFDCADAQGAGYVPRGWFPQASTYKEVGG
jgi:hypothetical protein